MKLDDRFNRNYSSVLYMTSSVEICIDKNRVLHQPPVDLGVEGFSVIPCERFTPFFQA